MLDDMWARRPEKERRYDAFFALLALRPGDCVLDVGCGAGGDALFVLGRYPRIGRIIAVEPSLKAIERARARADVSGERRIHLAAMDGRTLALSDASVDACFCARVLVHAHEAERILAEMIRVVRPGGRVLVIEPDRDGLLSPMAHDRVNRAFWAHRRSINPRIGIEAYGMMRAHGLRDVTVAPSVQVHTAPPSADLADEVRRNVSSRSGEYWLLVEQGVFTPDDLAAYAAEVEEASRTGVFVRMDLEIATIGLKSS
jgi:SAM-dependent methyltransferase